jgi:hypothetical protein
MVDASSLSCATPDVAYGQKAKEPLNLREVCRFSLLFGQLFPDT